MTVENFEQDPTAGDDAGASEQTQPTQPAAPAAPAARTYSDADMAAARRSFETDARRREAALRADLEQRFIAREQPKPTDPWAALDPQVATVFKTIFQRELEQGIAPYKTQLESFQQQQEDLAFANNEAQLAAKYPDYQKNRQAVLQFGAAAGIGNLDVAYHAWRSQTQWQDPEAIGKKYLADYQRRKATQSADTPLAEGRGGGAPSTKTNFRAKDGSLDKDAMDAAALEIINSRE